MLKTIYEQNTALAAYTTEQGGITMLASSQVDLTRKLVAAFEHAKEVTKIISTDAASIAVQISTG